MPFGKCRQNLPPDSASLRVRTPSKSHATPLNMTLLLVNIYELQNHFIFLMQRGLQKIPNIREMTRFWKHAKMKRDVLWENGLQIHLIIIIKKRRIWWSGKVAHFAKAIKILQKLTLNTHKRCFRGKTAKNTFNILENDITLKSHCGKNGHFVKAVVRQNRHKWRTLGMNFEDEE